MLDDHIAQKQADEDLQLFGRRSEPLDLVDLDKSTNIRNQLFKRSASEIGAPNDRPQNIRKSDLNEKSETVAAVIAMDWNSGASPLSHGSTKALVLWMFLCFPISKDLFQVWTPPSRKKMKLRSFAVCTSK